MSPPERFHVKRVRGWRKPEGGIVVMRPGPYGNPYPLTQFYREDSLARFRVYAEKMARLDPDKVARLRGHPLGCSCPLPAPGEPDLCHAAIWIEIANR